LRYLAGSIGMSKTPPPSDPPEQSFESAMQRLEGIVTAMESDELPLEELIVRYEEGISLVQVCDAKLKAAQKKIEVITRSAQGKPELARFEPDQTPSEKTANSPGDEVSLF